MGYFTFILPLAVFVTLFTISNSQMHLSIEMDQNERRTLEILKLLYSHPQFIYSEFMESDVNSSTKENASVECLVDIFQIMRDLLAGQRYSAMSKFLLFLFFAGCCNNLQLG